VKAFVKAQGATRLPEAAQAIREISDKDLEDRVVLKFKDTVKALKEAKLYALEGERPAVTIQDVESEREVEVGPVVAVLSKAQVQSRAKGVRVILLILIINQFTFIQKCEVRTRKRGALPPDSKWRSKKYDPMFVPTLMSDDEDEIGADGKRTGRFLSWAPAYRSEVVSIRDPGVASRKLICAPKVTNLLAAVDAANDPLPSNRYSVHVRGDPVDVPPKVAQKLENKARRWMVRSEWLDEGENLKFDVPSRLIDSGKMWGDDEDPKELEERSKKFKEEKAAVVKKKKTKITEKQKVKLADAEAKEKQKAEKKGKMAERKGLRSQDRNTRNMPEVSGSGSRTTNIDHDAHIDPRLRRSPSAEEDEEMEVDL